MNKKAFITVFSLLQLATSSLWSMEGIEKLDGPFEDFILWEPSIDQEAEAIDKESPAINIIQATPQSNLSNEYYESSSKNTSRKKFTIQCPASGCSRNFSSIKSIAVACLTLKDHIRFKHQDIKSSNYSIDCKYCNQKFSDEYFQSTAQRKLQHHIQKKHQSKQQPATPEFRVEDFLVFDDATINTQQEKTSIHEISSTSPSEMEEIEIAHDKQTPKKKQNRQKKKSALVLHPNESAQENQSEKTIHYAYCTKCKPIGFFCDPKISSLTRNFTNHLKEHDFPLENQIQYLVYETQLPLNIENLQDIMNYVLQEPYKSNARASKVSLFSVLCPVQECTTKKISSSRSLSDAYHNLTNHIENSHKQIEKNSHSLSCHHCKKTFSCFYLEIAQLKLKDHIQEMHTDIPTQKYIQDFLVDNNATTVSTEQTEQEEASIHEIRSTRPREIQEADQNDSVKKMKIASLLN